MHKDIIMFEEKSERYQDMPLYQFKYEVCLQSKCTDKFYHSTNIYVNLNIQVFNIQMY